MQTPSLAIAFDTTGLFEEYYERIYLYVLSMVRAAAEAEDLTQETFLRAYRERESLREPGAVLAWLYRIATHVCLDRRRQRSRLGSHEANADIGDLELPDTGEPSLQTVVEQDEMSACVQRYVAGLSDSYRAVLLLHDMHGLTSGEISRTLDIPLTTVKMRLHRARTRLRETLRANCDFSCDERNVLICETKE